MRAGIYGAMIETWSLGKTFQRPPWPFSMAFRRLQRPVRALDGVTLKIERGEIFGLLGPNGAGKTTLLKVLATLLLPSEGGGVVNGADLLKEPGEVRRAIGLATGDERGAYWRISGRENLEFFAGLLGASPRVARRRADAALELVDLLPHARELVGRYSTGMRQRLALARALLADPPVLLLDEPTRSLDVMGAERVLAVIQRLARDQGKTVLMATHALGEAARVCHRVAVLIGGTLAEIIAPETAGEEGLAARYRAALEVVDDTVLPAVGLS
jgi:ABC-2 type transport system ATP-binding protein